MCACLVCVCVGGWAGGRECVCVCIIGELFSLATLRPMCSHAHPLALPTTRIHTTIHTHTHVYTHTHTRVRTHTCTRARAHTHTNHARTHTCPPSQPSHTPCRRSWAANAGYTRRARDAAGGEGDRSGRQPTARGLGGEREGGGGQGGGREAAAEGASAGRRSRRWGRGPL